MRRLFVLLGVGALACEPSQTTTPTATPPAATSPTPAPSASATATAAPTSAPSAMLPETPADAPVSDLEKLATGQNEFGFELYRTLPAAGNTAISPASIGMALAMTYMGARGDTAAEMSKTLRLTMEQSALEKSFATVLHDWQAPSSNDDDKKVEIRVANRIFPDKSLEVDARFQSVTRRGFGAPLEQLDFRGAPEPARAHINGWVEEQTKSRIVDLLPPRSIDDETRMVLVNAIYLAAPWAEPFIEGATAPAAFFVDGKTEKQVPTMRRTDSFRYAKLDGLAVVEIPLRGGRFAFDVILPDARDGLPAAERILSAPTWKRWMDALAPKRVSLALPKFRVEPGEPLTLKEPLTTMGIHLAFDRDKADFTGIANPPSPADRLLIGQVFHKAFVDVNEAGVEAAAATAVVMPRAGSAAPTEEPIAFTVDHPFLFAIRDTKSGMVIFVGRVTDPKSAAR